MLCLFEASYTESRLCLLFEFGLELKNDCERENQIGEVIQRNYRGLSFA